MEYIVFVIITLVVISMFSGGGSGKKIHCSQCGKSSNHTYIESLKGYNRISDYYTCDCCGNRFTNDRFFK